MAALPSRTRSIPCFRFISRGCPHRYISQSGVPGEIAQETASVQYGNARRSLDDSVGRNDLVIRPGGGDDEGLRVGERGERVVGPDELEGQFLWKRLDCRIVYA